MMNRNLLLKEYAACLNAGVQGLEWESIEKVCDLILDTFRKGKKIITMGNGGHGSTASHFVNDLTKHTVVSDKKDKVVVAKGRLKAMCLCDNVSTLTAWANDTGYESCFERQIEAWIEQDDVVIAVSGSGNSVNIIRALTAAQRAGARTVCLTGREGGKAKEVVDVCVMVPLEAKDILCIEDIHLMICHMITHLVRQSIQKMQ